MKTNIEITNDCQLLDGLSVVPSQVERFAELVRADERAVLALEAKRNRNSTFALQLRARGNT